METQPHHHEAPTVRTIELDLLSRQTSIAAPLHGAATWLSRGIHIEEAGIILTRDRKAVGLHSTERHRLALARRAERLSTEIQLFLSEARTFLGDAIVDADTADNADNMEDGTHDSDGEPDDEEGGSMEGSEIPCIPSSILPLPSSLGQPTCEGYHITHLAEQELLLRTGQANDALHAIRLTLVNKAILFRNDIRHAQGQAANTRAWGKVKAADSSLRKHAAIYRKCRIAMVALGADSDTLGRYKELGAADLRVTTSVLNPNGSGHRNDNLAWFWSMDIPKDMDEDNWMSDCKPICGIPQSICCSLTVQFIGSTGCGQRWQRTVGRRRWNW